VAEARRRMPGDVVLDGVPVVLVVADLPAIGADRKDRLQRLHLGERRLQLLHQPFAIEFLLLASGDVAGDRVDNARRGVGCGVPEKPPVRAVLTEIAVLEA